MSKILSLFAIVLVAVSVSAMPVPAAPNGAQDVKSFVQGFATDWNHHDMDAFGKLFAPDADFVNVQGNWWKGRKEIQMKHAWSHGAIPRDTPGFDKADPHYGIFENSTMKFNDIEARFLRKDVAIARVKWELVGDTRTPKARRGMLLFVITRENDGWLIAAAQNTEINRTVK
jgi:ketosteroid isomerase-like protein